MEHREARIEAVKAGRASGEIVGHRLVLLPKSSRESYTFDAEEHGGARQSRLAALGKARSLGAKVIRPGARIRAKEISATGIAGIQLYWWGEKLVVMCKWIDGKNPKGTTRWFSLEKHGLEGAVQKAIAEKVSRGAPMPDGATVAAFMRRVKAALSAGPQAFAKAREARGTKTQRVLDAIRSGHRTLADIAAACEMPYRAVNAYVASLEKQGKVRARNPRAIRGLRSFVVTALGR